MATTFVFGHGVGLKRGRPDESGLYWHADDCCGSTLVLSQAPTAAQRLKQDSQRLHRRGEHARLGFPKLL